MIENIGVPNSRNLKLLSMATQTSTPGEGKSRNGSDGMQTLQVLDFIKLYPEQMSPLFVATNNVVTAGLLVKLCRSDLTIVYALIERFGHC